MDENNNKTEIIEALYRDHSENKAETGSNSKEEVLPKEKNFHFSIAGIFKAIRESISYLASKFYGILRFAVVATTMFLMIFMAMNYRSYQERINYWWNATAAVETEDLSDKINGTILREQEQIIVQEKEEPAEEKPQIIMGREVTKTQSNESELTLPKLNLESISFPVAPPDDRIIIPKIERNIPIVYATSRDDETVMETLKDGIVHYPETAYPGEIGNVFLTGHSSYYPWADGKFKTAFALLDKLVIGDDIVVYYKGQKYIYSVYDVFVVGPDDLTVMDQPTDQKILTLMTCTPVGTNAKRLIVRARQQN